MILIVNIMVRIVDATIKFVEEIDENLTPI